MLSKLLKTPWYHNVKILLIGKFNRKLFLLYIFCHVGKSYIILKTLKIVLRWMIDVFLIYFVTIVPFPFCRIHITTNLNVLFDCAVCSQELSAEKSKVASVETRLSSQLSKREQEMIALQARMQASYQDHVAQTQTLNAKVSCHTKILVLLVHFVVLLSSWSSGC